MLLVSFLLGLISGCSYNILEKRLIKSYEEIREFKKWPFYWITLLLGLLFMRAYQVYGLKVEVWLYMFLIWDLVFLAWFDLKYMLLPSKMIYVGLGSGIAFRLIQGIILNNYSLIINGLIGAVSGYILFLLLFYGSKWLLKKEGLGFGDVRLMALIGFFIGVELLPLMLIIASFSAVLVGACLYVIRKQSEAFPFGPFLCIGTLLIILFQDEVIHFYLQCMGI